MKTKILLPFLMMLIFILNACTKKSELGDLKKDNVMDPENSTDIFVLDSVRETLNTAWPNSFIQLYYHVNYNLLKDQSKVSKILLYKDGGLKYTLSPTQVNAYFPTDYSVTSGQTYIYAFAIQEPNGSISKFSSPHSIYFHV